MIPQLMLVTRASPHADYSAQQYIAKDGFTAHSIACVFAAKICTLLFQWRYFVAFKSSSGSSSAHAVFGAQVFQVVLLADFVYYYLSNMVKASRQIIDTYLV